MNVINFNDYLFRCSSLGKLMVGVEKTGLTDKQTELLSTLYGKRSEYAAKGKFLSDAQTKQMAELMNKRDTKPEVSQTTKSYLKNLHREVMMKRQKTIETKYTEKGITVEEKSISLYTNVFGKLLVKNKIRFADKYKTGEPDNVQGKVRDFKSSWDFSTFPMYDTEIENRDYLSQLDGYMDLTGKKEAELIYCLIDTPSNIIEDELRRLNWKSNIFNLEGEIREECIPLVVEKVSGMIYTEQGLIEFCNQSSNVKIEWFEDFFPLPEEMRIKVFQTEYSKERIELMHEQISKCREILNGYTLTLSNNIFQAV
ncbi:hypothetical protein HZQ94_14925 [Elizabethkingia anophelis]|nr:hypothetical protein [Elizabethkingia anophelis]MCT3682040.1 hypothetical protein [Elizabethkingia anophelis]